jgi:hypothetical protein
MEGLGGGEAQGVADPPKKVLHTDKKCHAPKNFISSYNISYPD